jgi:shikimate dehydrogenase
VLDFVTSPQPTDLIRRATDRGLRTVNGIAILIEQAAESFKLLFGADPPRDKDSQLLHKLAR